MTIRSSSRHVDTVLAAVESASAAALSLVKASWYRSARNHEVDPAATRRRELLGDRALRDLRESHAPFLAAARPALDQISRLVGQSGCGVALSDAGGVILERRLADGDAAHFAAHGLIEGAQWSEAVEGTNGIGTCLFEAKPVIIYKDQHFCERNIGISCMDAPIYGPSGSLVGAIDVTSCRSDHSSEMAAMIGGLVRDAARRIERDYFCHHFAHARIIFLAETSAGNELLVVDADDLVIGASRAARLRLGITDEMLAQPRPLDQMIGLPQGPSFEQSERKVLRQALARVRGNATQAARELGISRATFYRRMQRAGSPQ